MFTKISLPSRPYSFFCPCIRPLVDGGELVEATADKEKGASTFLVDLDGVKHPTRNKTDIHQRERDLYFTFRAMEKERWDFSIRTDMVLQVDHYLNMLQEQGNARGSQRLTAFTSCGIFDRIETLDLMSDPAKLKLLLTGAVLVEGTDPTLTLADFLTGDKISSYPAVCRDRNRRLVVALKNLQVTMQIVFSDHFEKALEPFISMLEGVSRPLELVSADYLKYSIELTLRKFFRVIRSVKGSSIADGAPPSNPKECAIFMTTLFGALLTDLSDSSSRLQEEQYHRSRVNRLQQKAAAAAKAVKIAVPPVEPAKIAPVRPCSGYIGSQLSALYADGKPYRCGYGRDCIYKHFSIKGKSDAKLLEIIAKMPAVAQTDLKKKVTKKA